MPKKPTKRKKPAGRPPKYPTPEKLQAKIDEYFEYCEQGRDTTLTDKKGVPILDKDKKIQTYKKRIPPTIEGLVRFLGFYGRSSLWNYKQKNSNFNNVITDAKIRVMEDTATRALTHEYDSKIASLVMVTHAGYTNKQSHEITGKDGGPIKSSIYTAFPDKPLSLAEWDKQVGELQKVSHKPETKSVSKQGKVLSLPDPKESKKVNDK